MRPVKKIHGSIYAPIADLQTYRPMPTSSIQHLDPFLFLNHHGPQVYGPNNNGLPFGPHPHRGFETLTYIFKGDITHWDSNGSKSVITEGGVQWMTAGSGLIHSEISSEEFKREGGEEEVIQLWMNLPAKHKMTPPKYHGLSKGELKHISEDGGKVEIHLISGAWKGVKGPHESISGLTMTSIDMKSGSSLEIDVPDDHQVLFYVVHGKLKVNDKGAGTHELVEFELQPGNLDIEASEETRIIFGHGKPFNEPIVAQGPFVMNTEQEIMEAFQDYQAGKMGSWEG
ncbi:MAG: pirin family protein [Bacteroidota bacterium]